MSIKVTCQQKKKKKKIKYEIMWPQQKGLLPKPCHNS